MCDHRIATRRFHIADILTKTVHSHKSGDSVSRWGEDPLLETVMWVRNQFETGEWIGTAVNEHVI